MNIWETFLLVAAFGLIWDLGKLAVRHWIIKPLWPQKSKTYLCSYDFRGERWNLEIQAENMEEAQQRARVLGVQFDGELHMTIRL